MRYKILWRERFQNKAHADGTISAHPLLYPNWEEIPNPEGGYEVDVWVNVDAVNDDDCVEKIKQDKATRGLAYHEVIEVDAVGKETAKFCLTEGWKKKLGEGKFHKLKKLRTP